MYQRLGSVGAILFLSRPAASLQVWRAVRFLWLCTLLLMVSSGFVQAQEETPAPRQLDAMGTATGCSELIANGGFEVEGLNWEALTPGLPAGLAHEYVVAPVFAGDRALRLGIDGGENAAITNGIFQTLYLPRTANPIVLGFHALPKYEADPGNDLQTLDIVDPGTGERITRLWAQISNSDSWRFLQFDLTALRGRTIRVQFAVSNDGTGGRTALYLDNISLLACDISPAPTPTGPLPIPETPSVTPHASPSPTWSPTPGDPPLLTPTSTLPWIEASPTATDFPTPVLSPMPPAGCIDTGIVNGGFEEPIEGTSGWILGQDPVPPQLAAADYAGLRALRLGNPPGAETDNVTTYSSVRQLITLPPDVVTAKLFWAHQSFTQHRPGGTANRTTDRQELILLTPELSTLKILYRQLEDNTTWQVEETDLTPYIGQTFYIYFNVFNHDDRLRTWMFLDEVRLQLCYTVPTPTVTPTRSPTPVVTVQSVAPTADLSLKPTAEVITATDQISTNLTLTDVLSSAVNVDSEVDVDIDTLQVVVPDGETAQRIIEEVTEPTPTLIEGFGRFLRGNWTWAIPWGVLLVLLVWRFLR